MKKTVCAFFVGSVLTLIMSGCYSDKVKLSEDEIALLKSGQDIVISAETGEIKGSAADKKGIKKICKDCGYPKGSLRQQLIVNASRKLDAETLQKLKEKKDIVISGKTGAVKGTEKDKKPSTEICPDCGQPKGSLKTSIFHMMQGD
ncbi:MAG: hypothetical protein A2017_01120 [Lentisphaerae bacterium GWF2_44_16]|nr:MAG: hypothetical protein A2017_01120 [Lentisphaerae bacterium GWF2_44_16]